MLSLSFTYLSTAVASVFALWFLTVGYTQNPATFPAPHSARDLPHHSTLAEPSGKQDSIPIMPYTIVSFETRKPDLTPAEFEDYYDNVHVRVIQEAMGPSFPKSHARYYLKRQPDDPKNANSTIPLVFIGSVEDVDYDAIVIMTFESEQHLLDFQTKYGEPDIAAKIGASADKFIIQSKLRVMGLKDPHITSC
ncbi:hypothetical protein BS50DRAFT_575141 [Corynespora cassiicola Philippines]|uniref:EthD domain-containing protein n=1 Tax=Corynespora cassiicola Philippines TaxID=1448308 RepID=A0A2T2NHY2_CORCC|nr:hypothetical protein BS50DRAFT_575141 [Corynespora cassiicola Philippines]